MNFPILPFCKSNIKNFKFNVTQKLDNSSSDIIVFKINGYKVKISNKLNKNDFIIFGKFNKKLCIIEEVPELDENFYHIMGKNFSEEMRSIAGIGISFLRWHKQTLFCGKCGHLLKFSISESNAKICDNCNTTYFPRINPAIIIVVKKGDSILVTRKSEWAEGRYGLVAGFIEYGENIEEAAIREVHEETGITIKNIKYIASQFWPFPFQLMIGLKADYNDGEIIIDNNELIEAKWFELSKITNKVLPPPSSIAYFLIKYASKS